MAEKIPLIYENVFAKSPEQSISAAKIRTTLEINLLRLDRSAYPPDAVVPVGTEILVYANLLYEKSPGVWDFLPGKTINVYHRLDTGTWEKIGTITSGSEGGGWGTLKYKLAKAGKHTFYNEFPGDDTYEGCGETVRAFVK
jgi:hypothetical protein